MPASAARIRRIAHDRLGIDRLRPGQREGVEAVLGGQDTRCVMSTGYGKSAIDEMARLLLDGPTVVVSPLIALQQDQVESIEEGRGISAGVINSTLTPRAREETLDEAEEGALEFLLMAPEQLTKPEDRRPARCRCSARRGRRGALRLAVGT